MPAKLQKNSLNPYLLSSIFYLLVVVAVATPFVVDAAQLLPACATGAGRCHLNDIVQTFVNFMRFLLGFVGSAVLVFFIYGGFKWLTSGGNSTKIEEGKSIVVNSIIGLIIVFGAFTIVQFVSQSLRTQQFTRVGQPCITDELTNPDNPTGQPGFYVTDPANPSGPPTCVTSCAEPPLPDAGYKCDDEARGKNCIPGLCDGATNIQCCQPL